MSLFSLVIFGLGVVSNRDGAGTGGSRAPLLLQGYQSPTENLLTIYEQDIIIKEGLRYIAF